MQKTAGKDVTISKFAHEDTVTLKRISMFEKRHLFYYMDRCVGCNICIKTCPQQAIRLGPIGAVARGVLGTPHIYIDEEKCVLCGICDATCPFNALDLQINGTSLTDLGGYPLLKKSIRIDLDKCKPLDEELCVPCRICEEICPRNAIEVIIKITDVPESKLILDNEKCTACAICIEICPRDAVTKEQGKINIDEALCIYCGACQKICPYDAITVKGELATIKFIPELREELCCYCRKCEEYCPENAIKVKKPFEGSVELEKERCQGCGTCIDACPAQTILKPLPQAPGQRVDPILIEEEFCVFCGACENSCPTDAIQVHRTKLKRTKEIPAPWTRAWLEAFNKLVD